MTNYKHEHIQFLAAGSTHAVKYKTSWMDTRISRIQIAANGIIKATIRIDDNVIATLFNSSAHKQVSYDYDIALHRDQKFSVEVENFDHYELDVYVSFMDEGCLYREYEYFSQNDPTPVESERFCDCPDVDERGIGIHECMDEPALEPETKNYFYSDHNWEHFK